jgi:ATP-dependent RNA helicase DDX52/ROK1
MLRTLANVMKLSGCDVPDWMLAMKPLACVW